MGYMVAFNVLCDVRMPGVVVGTRTMFMELDRHDSNQNGEEFRDASCYPWKFDSLIKSIMLKSVLLLSVFTAACCHHFSTQTD